jgi:hypothetical protein
MKRYIPENRGIKKTKSVKLKKKRLRKINCVEISNLSYELFMLILIQVRTSYMPFPKEVPKMMMHSSD